MEKILQAWNHKTIQEAYNISLHLSVNGKTWEDVKEYINNYIPAKSLKDLPRKPTETKVIPTKPCPLCGKTMRLKPVEDSDEYKSKWECCQTCRSGNGCGYVEFLDVSIDQVI